MAAILEIAVSMAKIRYLVRNEVLINVYFSIAEPIYNHLEYQW
jgi:hypothetical protein